MHTQLLPIPRNNTLFVQMKHHETQHQQLGPDTVSQCQSDQPNRPPGVVEGGDHLLRSPHVVCANDAPKPLHSSSHVAMLQLKSYRFWVRQLLEVAAHMTHAPVAFAKNSGNNGTKKILTKETDLRSCCSSYQVSRSIASTAKTQF